MNLRTLSRSLTLATFAQALLPAQDYAAFVLDRSGSMGVIRSGSGNTRAADCLIAADADLFWFFLLHPNSEVLLYEFHGAAVTPLGGTHTSYASATAALATVPGAGGNTPLAAAICSAVADVIALDPGASNEQPLSSCRAGRPPASSGDHCTQQWPGPTGAFNAGSWQDHVCSIVSAAIKTHVYYFDDFADVVDPLLFFAAITDLTGGTLFRLPDGSTAPPTNPWRTSGTGCRDFRGQELSMRHAGVPQIGSSVEIGCRTGNPLPYLLSLGLSKTSLGSSPLPIDLTPMGAPGCRVYGSWDMVQGFYAWDAMAIYQVPNAPALAGLALYFQGAQLHLLNNALGVATSNLLEMRLVP
jgi:hypothetical protein